LGKVVIYAASLLFARFLSSSASSAVAFAFVHPTVHFITLSTSTSTHPPLEYHRHEFMSSMRRWPSFSKAAKTCGLGYVAVPPIRLGWLLIRSSLSSVGAVRRGFIVSIISHSMSSRRQNKKCQWDSTVTIVIDVGNAVVASVLSRYLVASFCTSTPHQHSSSDHYTHPHPYHHLALRIDQASPSSTKHGYSVILKGSFSV
jgi:hypothetical protein